MLNRRNRPSFFVFLIAALALPVFISGCASGLLALRNAPTQEQKTSAAQGVIATEDTKDTLDSLAATVKADEDGSIEATMILPAIEAGRYTAGIAAQSARMVATDFGPPDVPATISPPQTQEAQTEQEMRTQAQLDAESNKASITDVADGLATGIADWAELLALFGVPAAGGIAVALRNARKWKGAADAIVTGVEAGRLPRAEEIIAAMPPEERIKFGLDPSGEYMVVDTTVSGAAHQASGVAKVIENATESAKPTAAVATVGGGA